jgi:hypothetical protein
MITDFEAYLLSKMRAMALVAATLDREGLSTAQLMVRANRAVHRWDLERPGYDASVYQDAIGKPVDERVLARAEAGSVFAGSVRRLYRLDLWPKVLYCVNQHPAGYAWGEGFVQTPLVLRDATTVRAWEWVDQTIESAASHVEVLDHWGHQKEIVVLFNELDNKTNYIAKFDFNLLQEWTLVSGPMAEEVSGAKADLGSAVPRG